MATIRQFEHYISTRIAFFEQHRREAHESELEQFDLVLAELNHIYQEVIPTLEEENGKVRDHVSRRSNRRGRGGD